MSWSYHKLVAEHGEERALELLQEQVGFGEYDPKLSHYLFSADFFVDTPCNDVHDEIPLHLEVTPICYLRLEVGWHPSTLNPYYKTAQLTIVENILSTSKQT